MWILTHLAMLTLVQPFPLHPLPTFTMDYVILELLDSCILLEQKNLPFYMEKVKKCALLAKSVQKLNPVFIDHQKALL